MPEKSDNKTNRQSCDTKNIEKYVKNCNFLTHQRVCQV
jgi:hypothetical protein